MGRHSSKQETFVEHTKGTINEIQDKSHQVASLMKSQDLQSCHTAPVTDRFKLVFLTLMLQGVGTLMPWNMFINAKSYFVDFKLNVNGTNIVTDEHRLNFLSYIGVASHVPSVICNAVNIFVQFDGKTETFRIVGSIVIEIIVFITTAFLAMVDSSTWPVAFFYITIASVVVINMANGIFQNSIYGLAAKLPMKYSMAIMLGSNTSGTFTSLVLILSIAASPDKRTSAIYYFISAVVILLACVDTYFALPLLRFYRYYDGLIQKALANSQQTTKRPPYCKILWKIWPQCFNIFFSFFVTLTIFPAMLADIKQVDPQFVISEKYFTPVTCYLCFNFFSMLGSLSSNWSKWPGPRLLWIPVVLRILLIPYFMLCNYKPDKRLIPVLVDNDWAYFVMVVILGLTQGYCSSLSMMFSPGYVDMEHAPIAGMMTALFLVIGVVSGVNFTFFISWILTTKLF